MLARLVALYEWSKSTSELAEELRTSSTRDETEGLSVILAIIAWRCSGKCSIASVMASSPRASLAEDDAAAAAAAFAGAVEVEDELAGHGIGGCWPGGSGGWAPPGAPDG